MIEKPISISEIYNTFKKSPDGIHLVKQIRYKIYFDSENSQSLEIAAQKNLGADLNNLKHMRLTLGLTQVLTRRLNINDEEKYKLDIASIIHDLPEAKSQDKSYQLKTEADEKKESYFMKIIAKEILFPNEAEKANFLINIYKEIVEDRTSKLGEIFNVVERIGYLRTGLNAYNLSNRCIENPNRYLWITHNVLMNQIPKLIDYSTKYNPVQDYILNSKNIITNAFQTCKERWSNNLDILYLNSPLYSEDIKTKFNLSHEKYLHFIQKQK